MTDAGYGDQDIDGLGDRLARGAQGLDVGFDRVDLRLEAFDERVEIRADGLGGGGGATLARSVAAVLATLNSEIAALEARAAEIVAADPLLKARFDALTSIPGVGRQTALVLQARMPELGRIDRRAAASLAGCAPHPRDSGLTRGRRTVWGGRASLKRALFMAAMAARNHDPAMRAFFDRLVHNGKPKMVAIVAVMRKIVVIANARIRTIDRHATG